MDFNERVYKLTKKIPQGKITTYKAIAHALNCKAYRAVGNALNKNPHKSVACHRVVKANGKVGGFATGTENKIKLLAKEGLEIKNNKVVDFDKVLFKF